MPANKRLKNMIIIKTQFLFFLLMLIAIPSKSQRLILRGGLTSSTISFTDEYSKNSKGGFSINVGYEFKLKSNFSLQPEIGLVSKGVDYSVSLEERTLSINYVETSTPLKYYFNTKRKLHILFGPTIAIGAFGKVEVHGANGDNYSVKFENYPFTGYSIPNEAYIDSRVDYGLQFGAGIQLWEEIIIDIRYTHGFAKLYTDFSTRGDFYNEPIKEAKNRSTQFTIGIPIHKKEKNLKNSK